MKLKNTVCVAALAVAGALGAASTASAQDYDRIVVFGDSLSDNGNVAIATGGASPAPGDYPTGRFSNGPTWVELLGFGSIGSAFGPKTGNVDMAFGGARTDAAPSPVPGISTQLGMYMGTGGAFGGGDLVTVWGGANDLFQSFATAAAQPSPTAYMAGIANTAAANVGATLNTIAGAGAGTILVANLPNLGTTPAFQTHPASPLATIASDAFNAALLAQASTQAAAHADTNIILMDVNRAFRAVQSDPARFGFTNASTACMAPGAAADCATPDTYVFWDGVHPTAAGHRLVAAMATDYLTYGDRAAATAVQAEAAIAGRRAAFDSARARMAGAAFDTGTRTFAQAEGSTSTIDARDPIAEADLKTGAVRMGVEHGFTPEMGVGISAGALQAEAEAGPSSFDLSSFSGDLFMGWRSGGLFLDATAGFSFDNYKDIRRVTALAPAVHQADTDGMSWGADLRLGWRTEMGGMTVSPRLGLSAIHAEVDGYAEHGAIARHDMADREVEAFSAEASVLFEGDLSDGMGASLELGYRDWVSYEGDDVVVSLVDNPAQALARSVEAADGGLITVDAGVGGQVWENVALRVGYRGRFGDGYDSHGGGLALTFRY